MKTKEKGDLRRPEYQRKDTNSSRIISNVKALFSSGKKLTAMDINSFTQSNDARKVISTLRAEGWNITDVRLEDGRKLYWLTNPDKQLSIFEGQS